MTPAFARLAPRRPRRLLAALLLLTTAAAAASAATAAPPPRDLYMDSCSACHQADGKGVPGAFPPLAGSPLVKGDPGVLATTVLTGRAGMPAFKDDISDADLSALLTFVRASWGNQAKPVTVAQMAAARLKANAGKTARSLTAH